LLDLDGEPRIAQNRVAVRLNQEATRAAGEACQVSEIERIGYQQSIKFLLAEYASNFVTSF
jgi:hypothetical protein